ncbi:MAG: M2 family metallopeptidase [Pirellulaceae bacterium]|nr:M2 family metallopeptidase [Planctomycetales bacterium]
MTHPSSVTSFCALNLILTATVISTMTRPSTAADTTAAARAFIEDYELNIRPLEIATNKAWWDANTTGSDEAYAAKEAAENKLDEALSSPERFARLKEIHAGEIGDPLSARQIRILYLRHLGKQVPPDLLKRMAAKANAIEKIFNVYRAQVGEQSLTDSQVRDILGKSSDSDERKRIWEASKGVGAAVEKELRELVFLRNEAARQLGFEDFHVMQCELSEQKQADLVALFDELDGLTREPFAKAKARIDEKLAQSYKITVDELRPWHYHDPFFQEAPKVYDVDLDGPLKDQDIVNICQRFYRGINLPIDDVIRRSDLFEKPGKSPHAFCTDIDRQGDVRVLANIVSNQYWMGTMLHELGHAVYSSKNIPDALPYLLRTDAHILCTEGVAMMFERFASDGKWLQAFDVPIDNPQAYTAAGAQMRSDKLLIFSRWCQVMLRFEIELYKNPGQDLNDLWWRLVHDYQGLTPPENRNAPDYASKIHIVSAPVYYHNYMMGELFACQVHAAIARQVLNDDQPSQAIYTDNPQVGAFMNEKVFGPGATLSWNELTEHATGEKLGSKAFAEEFEQ